MFDDLVVAWLMEPPEPKALAEESRGNPLPIFRREPPMIMWKTHRAFQLVREMLGPCPTKGRKKAVYRRIMRGALEHLDYPGEEFFFTVQFMNQWAGFFSQGKKSDPFPEL